MTDVSVYDTTLRLGAGGRFHPSLGDALAVVRLLDELGVAYAEIGEPGDNPRDATLFARVARELSPSLVLAAHASMPLTDGAVRALVASGARMVALSASAAEEHATCSPADVRVAVARLQAEGFTVVLDAEHAVAATGAFADDVVAAGADVLTLCDTLGGATPWQVEAAVGAVLGAATIVGVQCHDDGGLAVANTLAAVHAGARLVQVAVGGFGPRCGTADLAAVVAGIETKLGMGVLPEGRLTRLTHVSRAVAEVANLLPDTGAPYVGSHAFTSPAAGHIDPALVGNAAAVVVTGDVGAVTRKAAAMGIDVPVDLVPRVAAAVREREAAGLSYEAADASFELLLRAEVEGRAPRVFDLDSWRVIVERRPDGDRVSEATVKVHAGGERVVATAEGNGPVNALDRAIRSALGDLHPGLARLELLDYKVRILDGGHGTEAVTRVLITMGDGTREWVTVGAGENVIDASWQALDDALSFGLAVRPAS